MIGRIVVVTTLSFVSVLLWNASSNAQSRDGVWSDIAEGSIAPVLVREIFPAQYRTVALHRESLQRILDHTPVEEAVRARSSTSVMTFPLPDGTYGRFRIVESPVMAPELAARYPDIRTYLGQGIDDPTATVRFDWTPAGFHAMILSAGPTVFIDPYSRGNIRHYLCYRKPDLPPDPSRVFEEIGVLGTDSETAADIARIVSSGMIPPIGEELRTYRLAVATTGEYTIFHGGTVQAGLAAVVVAMNRVNGIYEREVAVRMVLVANNDVIIYTNPSTDPYTNSNGSVMLGQNQTNLDNVIGNANYDIGHVFSTGGGGVANLGVPCRTGFKARGVTGLPSPIGDPFYVDYVAHEMGHQFGANHTFNGSSGSCSGGNRNAATAYEPGSGSTVMAYAGICSPQNIQNNSDDYFHGISIDEIVTYTTLGSGNSCPVITTTGNAPPTVNAGPGGFTIPLGTPFVLTGSATDPDGDTLTYTWEEFDLGPAGHPNTPSGNAPIFRSFKGTSNPSRIFPRITDILNNTQTLGEILPGYARTLNMRLTARDNRAGGGGVGKASTTLAVSGTAGPFVVTSPNTAISWINNTVDTVRWNVANTNVAPVNCTNVNILLSTDGGSSFGIVLASNTANDGIEAVTVPNLFTMNARVKVEAVGNIFFDMSNVNFSIAPVAAPFLASPPNNGLNIPTSLVLQWSRVAAATSYHVQLSTSPSFATLVLDDSTLVDTARAVSGLLHNAQYYWRTRARGSAGISGWSEVWTFRTVVAPPAAPTLASPLNNAVNQPALLTMRWNPIIGVTAYHLQISVDSGFSTLAFEDSAIAALTRDVTVAPGTRFFWRVRAKNAGGFGPFSATWNFTTIERPAQVSLLAPPHGATFSADTVAFVWNAAQPLVTRYWFALSTDSLFTTATVDSTLTDTTKVARSLTAAQTYWWKVRAFNGAGWGVFSETRRFSILPTSVAGSRGIPEEFSLAQNYPNPFNPATVIEFALPQESHVRLEVFNLIGERVAVPVDERRSAGYYVEVFDGSDLASGVYFYRLTAGSFVRTLKLVLMR